MQALPLATALFLLATTAAAAALAGGGFGSVQGRILFAGTLLGGFAGLSLYHASFGFTSAYRKLVREGRGAGLRAQLLLLGLTSLVTYLLIGYEDLTGWEMHPVVMPMSLSSAIGAFMFGMGMQLGGGCASGTLYTSGGGSTKMLLVLFFFVIGSAWATAHVAVWRDLDGSGLWPTIPGTSLVDLYGPLGGVAALFALLAAIWALSVLVERRRWGALETFGSHESWTRGKWSLTSGAVALAIVGIGSFLLYGRPWGVTSGFALWGAQMFQAVGIDVAAWEYWQGWRADQLAGSVLTDRVSVMNFGIIFGAGAAAALAGRFRPTASLSAQQVWTAVVGGLLMGYGARLSFGCNIGAFLGGVVSGSLHGWWWLLWGFLGSTLGTWGRIRLSMDPPIVRSKA